MRSLALALMLALALLAGCVKPTTETPASTNDPTAPTPQQLPSPTPTTPPSPSPSPSPSPTSPSSPPPTAPSPPPSNATPPPPVVVTESKSGWVAPNAPTAVPPDANCTVTLSFPLAAGASTIDLMGNVTLVNAQQDTSGQTALAGATLSLVGPDGKVVKSVSTAAPQAPGPVRLVLEADASSLAAGTYKLTLVIEGGASDGSSMGDQWQVRSAVTY